METELNWIDWNDTCKMQVKVKQSCQKIQTCSKNVFLILITDSADSKSLIPLSFLADAPAACDAASEPVQVASLVLFRRRCMEILDRW